MSVGAAATQMAQIISLPRYALLCHIYIYIHIFFSFPRDYLKWANTHRTQTYQTIYISRFSHHKRRGEIYFDFGFFAASSALSERFIFQKAMRCVLLRNRASGYFSCLLCSNGVSINRTIFCCLSHLYLQLA